MSKSGIHLKNRQMSLNTQLAPKFKLKLGLDVDRNSETFAHAHSFRDSFLAKVRRKNLFDIDLLRQRLASSVESQIKNMENIKKRCIQII